MRHIKKYNESSNDKYFKVDTKEYSLKIFGVRISYGEERRKSIPFSSKENLFIRNNCNGSSKIFKVGNESIASLEMKYSTSKSSLRSVFIDKLEDEWYGIIIPSTGWTDDYYLCDQWDGLLEFLSDFGILNQNLI